ncbi:glycosyl hydrolase [Actinoplanes lobatus]|uniref:Glycosyl hydrolase n=1 Tax=Actinoplanes lobatus TaxID=113568 RepID=A0A7W7HKM2_9ACTN|nr:ThuA domain-containing protein [Actinoplanes lobatus]MBB4752261.1 type 1 glutamine amidotransferase [Actinoplanes lobatus]GGN98702.1 glycosyl hydrolase [Actinoplanes lobatus]GIE46169.1 glycosyl hydrolase [Actinoplanes lobatus]
MSFTRLHPLLAAALTAALTAAVILVGSAVLRPAAGPSPSGAGPDSSARNLGRVEYGVCRGPDPSCYHDWGNFDPATDGYRVLVYSRTAGPRHAHLGPVLAAGLNPPLTAANAAQSGLVELGADNGFAVDWTEDVTQLNSPARLFRYNAVIFMSTTRDALDDPAQTALRQYIRGGGGFVGIHNAFGTEYNWEWYEGLLGGTNYYDHGRNQPGTVVTTSRRDASTAGLPGRWDFTDEWYNLVPFPTGVRILATVDEATLPDGATGGSGHPGHGRNHPVSWCQYYDGGRSWVTTLGHEVAAWNTDGTYFKAHVLGGIESAMGRKPFCR